MKKSYRYNIYITTTVPQVQKLTSTGKVKLRSGEPVMTSGDKTVTTITSPDATVHIVTKNIHKQLGYFIIRRGEVLTTPLEILAIYDDKYDLLDDYPNILDKK